MEPLSGVQEIDGRRSVLILYGSETGNSQDIAEELGRCTQRLYFKTVVEELDNIQLVGLTRTSQIDLR
jgi:flavodoxin